MGASSGGMKQGGFAGMDPYQQAASAQASALGGTQAIMGYQPQMIKTPKAIREQQVQAGQLAGTDMSAYMNPYEQAVIDQSMQDIERQRLMQQNVGGAQASAAGAFGGSRHGIAEAETNRAFAEQQARTAAGLRQQGYTQAQQMAQQDIASRMQAALANQGANLQAQTTTGQQRLTAAQANQAAGLQGAQLRLSAANQLGGLGQTSFGYGTTMQDRAAAEAAQQQAMQQALMGGAETMFNQYQGYPQQQLGYLSNIIYGAPHGETTTKNLGIMDYATMIASMIPKSDSRLKKNIQKIKTLANGVNVYKWDWTELGNKLKTATQPAYGVIAQEIKDRFPEAVKMAPDGYYGVDYSHPELKGIL